MPGDKALIDFVRENEKDIKKWLRWRPTTEGTYEDLLRDTETGVISVNRYKPGKEWDDLVKKKLKGRAGSRVDGVYTKSDETMSLKEGSNSLPHEVLHYFSGHTPGSYGVSEKINPYIKADMKLKGWLPSIHPGGRRPTMPGKFAPGEWWNKKMATKDVKFSDENKYHPWFDEHSFDLAKTFGSKSSSGTNIKTKKFDIKNKIKKLFTREEETPSFGQTFKEARKSGVKEFEWKGKKYHTKYKEEIKPKESFLDRWNKSWAFRGSNY